MNALREALNQYDQAPWAAHLQAQAQKNPERWADDAFCDVARLIKYPQTFDRVCETIFQVANTVGWGSFPTCLLIAMRQGDWDLVPWILKAPVKHDFSSSEIDYLVTRDLSRGVWPHVDLLRPDVMLDERNVNKLGHDLFKHNENTYYSPLKEDVICKLVQLPKHEHTDLILGFNFTYAQRLVDCDTDMEAPGVLECLAILAKSGWLDLNAAREVLDKRDNSARRAIALVENAMLDNVSRPAIDTSGIRRM